MHRILTLFRPLLLFNYKHPYTVLGIGLILSVFSAYYALQLKVDTDIANLLPKDHPNVLALEELKNTVGGETEMQVAINSPSFEANKRFAEDLIPKTLELFYERYDDYYFKRAEYRKETEVLKDNALYFATSEELDDIIWWLEDEIEEAKEDANPFLVDFGFEDDEEEDTPDASDFEESYDTIVPTEYPVSEDSTVMLVKFFPTGSKSDIQYLEDMFAVYDSLIASMDPASYHPEMQVQFGGRLKRHLEELSSVMRDVFSSFATGFSSVVLLVMFYFFFKKYIHYRRGDSDHARHKFWQHLVRMPIPVLVIGVPLIFSLIWTFGLTYWNLGMLNTMTSVLFVILFGLGIDYGIHYYARYIELRSEGLDVREALIESNEKTGEAILVSAFTTAAALYVLMFADFRGFSEFGFISGTGILLALFSMLYVMPSILVLFERWHWLIFNKPEPNRVKPSSPRYPFARLIVLAGLFLSALILFNSGKLSFQYDFSELEPEFPEYRKFREVARQAETDKKRNPAYILTSSDESVMEVLGILRAKIESDTTSPTINSVEALQERFPTTEDKSEDKLEIIAEIRELLQDPFIVNQEGEDLDKLRRASKQTEAVEIDEVPEYLKAQFLDKDGELGKFVIIYPSEGLSDGRKSIAFKEDIGRIELSDGTILYAASTSLVAASMLDLIRKESPYMVGATLLIVFIFMLFSFRSLRWAIISMVPLLVGLLFTFGAMILFGLQFNFYNLIVLPAILGIGEDNGVHLAHRYREEGRNSMRKVLESTGQHITMGSVTTMLGFAGLLFTKHPGLQSLGILAVLGIGMTLLTALIFLPAMIQWLEDLNWIKFNGD
jgi:hypothetical protein